MNITKKNIVLVDFLTSGVRIPLPKNQSLRNKFRYAYSLYNAYEYQGFILVYNNKYNISINELDKNYRSLFNKFDLVLIYNESYGDYSEYGNKWFKVYKIGKSLFEPNFFDEIWDEYKFRKNHEIVEKIKYNRSKKEKLDILYKYTKKYETRKTVEIVNDLKMNERTIQRYMNELNKIYHNVGYDYKSNEWYFLKKLKKQK